MNTEQINDETNMNVVSQETTPVVPTEEPVMPQEDSQIVVPSGVEAQTMSTPETPTDTNPLQEIQPSVEDQVQPVETSTNETDPLGLNDGKYTAEEVGEQPEIIKVIDKKPLNKKLIVIIAAVVVVLAIIGVIIFFVFNKQEKKQTSFIQEKVVSNDSQFVKAIKNSVDSGDFDKEIQKGLVENDIDAEKVYLLSLDIDSDEEQEIIVYVEEKEKKYILSLEVDEKVYYDDSYPVEAKDSLGYAYSAEKREMYWYTEYSKNYTIIGSTKKIIKEEDFLENYFPLTKTYEEMPILVNAIEYKFDKELNAEKLEKNEITNKDILKDNKIEKEDIKDLYEKYKKEKEEEDKKKQEEEDEKARQEEETRKLSGNLKLGNASYRFGTYNAYSSDGSLDGTIILYGDLTCVHKGVECTYTVGEVRGENDTLVPGISLSTGQIYIASKNAGELTNVEETITLQYAS